MLICTSKFFRLFFEFVSKTTPRTKGENAATHAVQTVQSDKYTYTMLKAMGQYTLKDTNIYVLQNGLKAVQANSLKLLIKASALQPNNILKISYDTD